jgi:hypothetical protein
MFTALIKASCFWGGGGGGGGGGGFERSFQGVLDLKYIYIFKMFLKTLQTMPNYNGVGVLRKKLMRQVMLKIIRRGLRRFSRCTIFEVGDGSNISF